MSTARNLNMALIGGGIGSLIGRVHWKAATLFNEASLVAGVFSSQAEKSKKSAQTYGLAEELGFSSFEDLIAFDKKQPIENQIDFVSITTPNHLHVRDAKLALEAGYHVICDKPLSHDLEVAKSLEEIVKKSGKVFVLTHNYSGYPLIRYLRDLVASKKLGDILNVRARYIQGWLTDNLEQSQHKQAAWRTDPTKSGPSGCFADIGTHAFQLAQYVSGLKPEKVSSHLKNTLYDRTLDDYGKALIECQDGSWMDITASQISQGYRNHFALEVDGTVSSAYWLQEEPEKIVIRKNGAPDQVIHRAQVESESSFVDASSSHPAGHPEGYLEAFANIYRGAFTAIHAASRKEDFSALLANIPGIKDGIEGMRFVNACVSSSRDQGKWISLN